MINHPRYKLTDADFVSEFETIGPRAMARKHAINYGTLMRRRVRLETTLRRQLVAPASANHPIPSRHDIQHPGRLNLTVKNGVVIVGGDGHYWPGDPSTAHRAFVKFSRDMHPAAVIMNGDAFDGASISRHASIMWERKPAVIDELEAVQARLGEIEQATPLGTQLFWPLGNHDARFETRLATTAPEYARINGFHLKDHFGPRWRPCWSVFINDSVVVKHRYKGGIHAAHNNVMWAGKTMVTNHLHSPKVTPFTDYGGTRYGVDTGCLADPDHEAFLAYTEDNPKNWRAGFAVLTFKDGKLLMPELVQVWDKSHVQFRGEIIKV